MRINRCSKPLTRRFGESETSLTRHGSSPALSLYRALLRECSYLPDPNSRKFFHGHIVSRFRAYGPHPGVRDPCCRSQRPRTVHRQTQILRNARKGLNVLCRANHGHLPHLKKILAITYGRIGPRRYELLRQLKVPDSPTNAGVLEDVLRFRAQPANQQVPSPSRALLALMISQAKQPLSGYMRRLPIRGGPVIPAKNTWGRPMPMKRVRNMKRKWYTAALSRVMPPLPEAEWETLRRMALGEARFRRPALRKGPSRRQNLGAETHSTGQKLCRPHHVHSRYMRRLWAEILQQCPLMRNDPSRPSGWDISWSNLKTEVKIGLDPILRDESCFDGVDENGKLLALDFG